MARRLLNNHVVHLPSDLLFAAMRDGALVNSVAKRTASIRYNHVMDVGCFSHTLDHNHKAAKS